MVKGVEKKQLSIGTEVSMTSPAGHSALYNLPLVFITPFGRCGNLYLLSLLDSHEQILLFPFSFYRYWNVIFAEQAVDPNSMFSCWKNFFQNSDMFSENPDALYKADYPKIFDFTENQVEKFYSQFRSLLFDRGISRKNVFFSIWEAYLEVKETDLSKIKVIVSHDHLPFSLGKMVSDFSKSRFLFLIRDVRAAIAGSLKNNKNFFGDVPDQSFNLTFEMWWEGVEFLGKHSELMGEGLKVIRNEDLNNNVEAEMRKIAAWLGIEFSQSLKESTYKGKPWYVKTSYSLDKAIPVNGEYVAPDQKDFHSETNQNIR